MLDHRSFDPPLRADLPPATAEVAGESDNPLSPAAKQPQPPPAAAQANPETGRDAHGRFARGCKGGPGNPFARQTAAYRRAIRAAVSEDDIQAMARLLREQALQGNLAAIKMVFLYTIGKPGERTMSALGVSLRSHGSNDSRDR